MRTVVSLFVVLIVLPLSAYAAWNMTVPDFPTRGEPTKILIHPKEGEDCQQAQLFVTRRPNSKTEKVKNLGTPSATCTIDWIPEDVGITKLAIKVGNEKVVEKNVSVRFEKNPASGSIILIVAGIILYGGIVYAFKINLSQEDWK